MLLHVPFSASGVLSDFLSRLLILIGLLLSTYILTRYLNRKPFEAAGFSFHSRTFYQFTKGCVVGFLLMAGICVVELAVGFIQLAPRELSGMTIVTILVSSGIYFLVGASMEEVLFRGYAFQSLIQGITFLPATIVMAVLFAYLHYFNPNASLLGMVNVAGAAVFFSIAYMKTRALWLPIGIHFAWNFSQTTLFGFPTSGVHFTDKELLVLHQGGPEIITGGAFGPEGGLLATLALIVGTWYILKSQKLFAPEGVITLDSLEDVVPTEVQEGMENA